MTTPTTLPAPAFAEPEIPPDVIFQLYLGALRGPSPITQLARHCAAIKYLGMSSVLLHGFPREMQSRWRARAACATDAGLLALASWGLDSSKDNDGSRLTAREKGECIGAVLSDHACAAGLLDAEGQWDSKTGPDDDMDEAGALALGGSLRVTVRAAGRPNVRVGDQLWFAIESHGDLRPASGRKPIGEGGCFRGFPVDEFAADRDMTDGVVDYAVNWGRYRQLYCNDFPHLGRTRYDRIREWADRDWGKILPALAAAGITNPVADTLQGYGWGGEFPQYHKLVAHLLERIVVQRTPVFLWSDPYPTPDTIGCVRAFKFLVREGYAQGTTDPRAMVRAFQLAANRRGARLDVDGWCGRATMASMGIVL